MPTWRSWRPSPTIPTAPSRRCAKRSSIRRSASSFRRKTASATKSASPKPSAFDVDRGRADDADGAIATRRASYGRTAVSAAGAAGEQPVQLALGYLSSTGLTVKVVQDWRSLKWSKLALNVVANASCAILNVLPNRFVHFDKIFTLEIRMIREVRSVMHGDENRGDRPPALSGAGAARRRHLPARSRGRLLAHRNRRRARAPSRPRCCSTCDAHEEPRTEVDVLNGAVAAAGREHGVRLRSTRCIRGMLSDIAHTPPALGEVPRASRPAGALRSKPRSSARKY